MRYGYLKDAQGNITDKCELPDGHALKLVEGYTFHEVADAAALQAVVITPRPPDPETVREGKIQAEIRAMAIERLKARGEIV